MGVDYAALARRTLGVDQPGSVAEFRTGLGAPNAGVLVGPVVINELMYHPPSTPGQGDESASAFEYVELLNLGSAESFLFDVANPTNRWRLSGAIQFAFPAGSRVGAHDTLLVVGFDPAARPDLELEFRDRYGLPEDVPVMGPYSGALSNAGERIELLRPDHPQGAGQPDAGYVPYLLADAVEYRG